MKKTLTTLVVASALAAPGAAAARPADYVGKTDQGTKVSVWKEKKGYLSLTTSMPSTCVSAQGGTPRVLPVSFDPPYAFLVGRTAKFTVKGNPTKNYTVTIRRRGRALTGKLSVNYSRLTVGDFGGYRILTCQGDAKFKLRVR
ncbi:MAG TPA: hypothetical protein VEX36_01965 [Thermoleophilaceae bacterium]|nr:hypothetical protein [Thermoleophilaceae bacterium]